MIKYAQMETKELLILFNKPYLVLSQFTDTEGRPTLADYISIPGLYPAGRLDYDSEGLLLLTNVGWLQHQIAHPQHKLPKTYWVEVEGVPDAAAINRLEKGVEVKGKRTRPANVRLMEPPSIWRRVPPIRERKEIPTSWLSITITEGRKRQVRHMTAAVGLPTLRLIRWSVGPWELGDLQPGQWREVLCPRDIKELSQL